MPRTRVRAPMAAAPGLQYSCEKEFVRMKLLYFAWLRERIGKNAEEIEPPPGIATVGDLVAWLAKQGDEYAHAFANPGVVRAAIDRAHVKADAPIASAREIAFFPPMTGG